MARLGISSIFQPDATQSMSGLAASVRVHAPVRLRTTTVAFRRTYEFGPSRRGGDEAGGWETYSSDREGNLCTRK